MVNLLMSKFFLLVIIFIYSLWPIFAFGLGNQARNDIENLIYKAINLSKLNYNNKVAIIPSMILINTHISKFSNLVEESMESIFASSSTLVDKDKLKKIKNEMKIIQKKVKDVDEVYLWLDGTTLFEGVPLSLVEGIDYFAWSNIKQISQDTINLKISVLEIKTAIVEGVASGEIKIDDILLSSTEVGDQNYSKWREEYQSASFWKETGMWSTRLSIAIFFLSIGLEGQCPDYLEKGFDNAYKCQLSEYPATALLFTTSVAGMIAGPSLWWFNAHKLRTIKGNPPVLLSLFPSRNGLLINVSFHF